MFKNEILIIDDDPKLRDSVRFVLDEYKIHEASSGEEAMKILLGPHQIDLILLDIQLADVSGSVVLEKIRNLSKKIPVIILTAFPSKEVMVHAIRENANDFIEKPFEPDDLKQKIEALLRQKEQIDMDAEKGDLIQRIMALIDRNFTKDISLEQIAEAVSLSPKYVSRLFRNKTGKTVTEYRLDLRMKSAKSMLLESSQSVIEISNTLGYENPESFMKMFKKMVGCTPTEFRNGNKPLSHC